ncbi:hypothetical protein DW322_09835 [Rhodococcus rhodnii]|uniref:Uncharacterized protein n=2 Tax=Rhodococcus rhodnii TaxID=38312 RepID=R7WJP8_9NOCA|nr:hypothetical protein [Rhodococcus rhodnii]EOM75527.1 hypothetical protein Rrhod_3325 [Rhodococcus rhodnii LMG 5362]TXG90467.1 hypothetical protein DW322_09835 [Rhodococcus rhodnii]
MSRTDAHTPFFVRLHFGEFATSPYHASCHPECDLPERPPLRRDYRTNCTWLFQYTGIGACSCWMCHEGPQARRANRRERQRDRRVLADALKAWRAGEDDAFEDIRPTLSRLRYM